MRAATLDLDLLRCFVAVAGAGSFTRAGDAIGLTQSGVSVRIRRLEEQVETRLFERSSRSVALTAEGEVLLGYARRLLDLNDETMRRLHGAWAEGLLHVGIADYFAPQLLPSLLQRFRRHYPRVRLDVRTGLGLDLIPAFERGELDIVVAGQEEALGDGDVLVHERLVWVMAPAFRLAQDAIVPLVALPHPCSHRRAAIEGLEGRHRRWEVGFTSSSIAGVQAAVRAGLGIGVLPESAVIEELVEAEDVLALPPLPPSAIAAFARDGGDPTVRAFLGFLRDELASLGRVTEAPRLGTVAA